MATAGGRHPPPAPARPASGCVAPAQTESPPSPSAPQRVRAPGEAGVEQPQFNSLGRTLHSWFGKGRWAFLLLSIRTDRWTAASGKAECPALSAAFALALRPTCASGRTLLWAWPDWSPPTPSSVPAFLRPPVWGAPFRGLHLSPSPSLPLSPPSPFLSSLSTALCVLNTLFTVC